MHKEQAQAMFDGDLVAMFECLERLWEAARKKMHPSTMLRSKKFNSWYQSEKVNANNLLSLLGLLSKWQRNAMPNTERNIEKGRSGF